MKYVIALAWFFLMLGPAANQNDTRRVPSVVGPFPTETACQDYIKYLGGAGADQFGLVMFNCWQGSPQR